MKLDKLIWFAIVFSTFIYAAIVWTLAPNPEGTFSEAVQKNQLTLILYLVAIVSFAMASIIPKFMSERTPRRTRMIVKVAMYEACTIYGLMAAMIVRDWRIFVPTWILGLIGMWMTYPSDEVTLPV